MKKIIKFFKIIIKWILIFFVFVLATYFSFSFFVKLGKVPKLNSNWEFGQEKTASVVFEENLRSKFSSKNEVKENVQDIEKKTEKVTIKNLRDFSWTKEKKEDQKKYLDYNFNLSDIKGLKLGVSHFSTTSAIAHVFIIFDLENGKDFGISIESRRDNGEKFSLFSGLKYDYELIYILATEKDLLELREKRNEEIYLYPVKISAQKAQEVFKQLSKRINSLDKKAEFYHLFSKNCTVLIADEIEKISDKNIKFPFFEKVFAPGYTGKAVFEMGFIKTEEKDFKKMKKKFLVKFNK